MSYREITDAKIVEYTPSTLSEWAGSADPGNVDNALDQIASRIKAVELSGGGIFGDKFSQASSLGLSSITGTTAFQQKLRLTFTAVAGTYIVFGKFSWRFSSTAISFKARIQTDDATDGFNFELEPKDIGVTELDSVCTFYLVTLDAGSHDIDLDYGTTNISETAYISNSRLAAWRVS